MRIFDLTNGKYACTKKLNADQIEDLVMGKMEKLGYPNDGFLYKRFSNNLWQKNLQTIIQEVPIFLVDTDMSCKMVPVPGAETSVYVPEDEWDGWLEEVNEENIEDWFSEMERKMRERENERPEEDDQTDKRNVKKKPTTVPSHVIFDLLGVYHFSTENDLCPRRIFVWVNKIENLADTLSNAEALLQNVVLHELGHAMMDTTLCEVMPSKYFSYKDAVYKYIEEAMANAFALMMDYDNYNPDQKKYIENFIKGQGFGYSEGWNIFEYDDDIYGSIFNTWISIKVIFKLTLEQLHDFWKMKDWEEFMTLDVENHRGISLFYKKGTKMGQVEQPIHLILDNTTSNKLIPFSDDENKTWGLIDNTGKLCVPAKYEEIKLDSKLNRGSFWGRTSNKWGLTDTQNNLLTAFEYDDVEPFGKNGLCKVQCGSLYGMVNIFGHDQIPVIYDFIWPFDKNGLCKVKIGKLYGVVNTFGQEQIPVVYDYLYDFYKDRTIAKYKGQYYIIDDQNNRLFDLSVIDTWNDIRGFNDKGLAPAQNSTGLWGIIDCEGNLVMPCTSNDMPKL